MGRAYDPARATRERLLRLERQEAARTQARAVSEGVEETIALSRARGAAIVKTAPAKGERETPHQRQSGLDWLARKGRISGAQKSAGEAYGESFRRAHAATAIGSTLEVQPGMSAPGGPSLNALLKYAAGRQQAQARLGRFRGRLLDQADLVGACDLICGQELTPREAAGGEREAGRLEAVLKVALDILSSGA